jgi:hypothetical protein
VRHLRWLRHLDHASGVGDDLALRDQLFGGLELAGDLLRCVPGAFRGRVPGLVWPNEETHSLWTGFRGPRQEPSSMGVAPLRG